MRETSERSHRQLFRLIVQWRESLEIRANQVFESLMSTGGLESLHLDVDSLRKLSEKASQYAAAVTHTDANTWYNIGTLLGNNESFSRNVHPLYDGVKISKNMNKITTQLFVPSTTTTTTDTTDTTLQKEDVVVKEINWGKLTVAKLKIELKSRNLSIKGKKKELVNRLKENARRNV